MTCALLMAFEGTIGIYQGEELGQTETELVYGELTDPPAIRFWPGIKGRDGCRTPMVWEAEAANGGFSDGTPWLPVKAPQLAHAVDRQGPESILEHYRETLAFRKASAALRAGTTAFLELPEPLLAFRRMTDRESLTCIFNLSPTPLDLTVAVAAGGRLVGPRAAELNGASLSLPGNGFAYIEHARELDLTMAEGS